MSWPIKLRAMSFAITIGVTLLESVMGSVAIALILWSFVITSARALLEIVVVVSAIISFSISIYSHLRPPILSAAVKRGDA
ncbi:MAG TPA: hypothetical protein VLI44_10540 [Sporolactobacillaceae bacterium]|nr:hypothetical protein [Sporolactobacillaceae bacterium]